MQLVISASLYGLFAALTAGAADLHQQSGALSGAEYTPSSYLCCHLWIVPEAETVALEESKSLDDTSESQCILRSEMAPDFS